MDSSRRFTFRVIILLGISLIFFRACKDRPSLTEAEKSELSGTYDSLHEGVTSAWADVLQNADQTHFTLQRMVQVMEAEGHEVPEVSQAVTQLGPYRMEMEAMDSEAIDVYDSVTYQVTEQTLIMLDSLMPSKDAMTLDMVNVLHDTQKDLLILRINYDAKAASYNAFVKANMASLEELYPAQNLNPYPLFQLSSTE